MQAVAARRPVDAPDQLREELAIYVGAQHADRLRAARDQAARGSARDESELERNRLYALTGLRRDVGVFVQRARDGRDGYIRGPCNVPDGRCQPVSRRAEPLSAERARL